MSTLEKIGIKLFSDNPHIPDSIHLGRMKDGEFTGQHIDITDNFKHTMFDFLLRHQDIEISNGSGVPIVNIATRRIEHPICGLCEKGMITPVKICITLQGNTFSGYTCSNPECGACFYSKEDADRIQELRDSGTLTENETQMIENDIRKVKDWREKNKIGKDTKKQEIEDIERKAYNKGFTEAGSYTRGD